MKNINQHIEDKTIKQFYLIYGEEDYLKSQYKDKLVKALLNPEDTMNYSRYEGAGVNVLEVLEIANTLPFFSDSRVIVLENSKWFEKYPKDLDLEMLEALPDSTYIIFVESDVDKRGRLYKWIDKHGYASAMNAPDGFGRAHPIPEGLVYNLPLSIESDQSVTIDSLETETYLHVWTEYHGGMYMYDFYYSALPEGDIYLRCFEATKNIPLSEGSILDESRVSRSATTSFTQLVNKKRFTIYEGDWEDYYAARIEVWHKDASTQKETKLLEKVYRVDGWMR